MANVLTFTRRSAVERLSPKVRVQLEAAAQAALDNAERIIAILDQADGLGAYPAPQAEEASQVIWLSQAAQDEERTPCA